MATRFANSSTSQIVTADQKSVRYHFSGHETFPFRYTWLSKGVQKIAMYPDLFSREDAIVILGVGKNMVSSIRHWCETLELIESPERGTYIPTNLGSSLFSTNGWDPYLENPGTLWLLHWLLSSRLERASTWCLAFTRWNIEDFSRDQLADYIWRAKSESPTSRGTRSSIRRDVDVFLRTYVPSRVSNSRPLEDTFDCPLIEIGIISEINRSTYRFVRGPKPSLPDEILLLTLLEFWNMDAPKQNTLSFEAIMHSMGSPGGVFKLTENALIERLERLPQWSRIAYGDTAGRRVIYRLGNIDVDTIEILRRYYGKVPEGSFHD